MGDGDDDDEMTAVMMISRMILMVFKAMMI